ncbi:hypothetical protein B566_EDAN011150 [Ephemera danica]|nr:hypothetical protein B566_EDAN011150 [Ephemera danica]
MLLLLVSFTGRHKQATSVRKPFGLTTSQRYYTAAADRTMSTVRVEAVQNRSVSMPCDIEPLTREDRVYMVLWFKEAAGKPLYSWENFMPI